jgi:methylmalonyl-CoA mutase
MADVSIEPLRLKDEFPPVTTDEWEQAIRADLGGADYEKKLVWQTDEGISVRPYYRGEHIAGLEAQTQLRPGDFPFVRGDQQSWKIIEPWLDPPSGAVRADVYHERGGTAVHEVAFAIAEGVERLAVVTGSGASVDEAASSLCFVFAVGSNYFMEIAKLRAARLNWAQAVSAFGPVSEASCRMRIHVRTAMSNKSIYDPYTNLLRSTTEALSAVIGGCDSLQVQPFRFSERLAVNVQRILKEESHLDRVADPAGGSYYIEALTDAVARESWKLFQQVESAGGYAKATGLIERTLAESRQRKEKAVALRRRTLVGVNNYPDLNETATGDAAKVPAGVWRAAEPFERIRLRSERHAAMTGHPPRVLLLVRGDMKMRMARAQFCLNFFGCGGFEVRESHDIGPADMIVLCSSDREYVGIAREVCPNVTVPVLVAGNPKDQIDALTAAGVAGFVHLQSNAVETLEEWQSKLGMVE